MKLFLYSVFSISLLFLASCKKECDFWLEGDDCGTEVRLDYYGSYNGVMEENSLTVLNMPDRFDVDVSITEYPNDAKRMYLQDPILGQIYIVLNSETSFSVPYQDLLANFQGNPIESFTIEGSGSLSKNQLSYTINAAIETTFETSGVETFQYSGFK